MPLGITWIHEAFVLNDVIYYPFHLVAHRQSCTSTVLTTKNPLGLRIDAISILSSRPVQMRPDSLQNAHSLAPLTGAFSTRTATSSTIDSRLAQAKPDGKMSHGLRQNRGTSNTCGFGSLVSLKPTNRTGRSQKTHMYTPGSGFHSGGCASCVSCC